MTTVYRQLADILGRFVSAINATGMLRRAMREANLQSEQLTEQDLPRLVRALEVGINLFVADDRRAEVLEELQRFAGRVHTPRTITIASEQDVAEARTLARRLCEDLGARSLDSQKVATAVSELTRNILIYAGSGRVELVPASAPTAIKVLASDNGPGIKNLDEILAGKYRSKTGLGRGLLAVKRMASTFDIVTGSTGTRIQCVFSL
jgi:serine/threonine-protein kinase RsbT